MNFNFKHLVIKNPKIIRYLYTSRTINHQNPKLKEEATICSQAINEAEKVVGYPTSFLNLRWLLNDEIANIALHVRKLLGTNHPLLKSARDLLLGKQTPTWGLVVLLISKAGGLKSSDISVVECDLTAGILHKQRVLAEVTEMVRTSHLIHKSLMHIDKSTENVDDIHFGNKLALLTGDYLLSTCFRELAGMKNSEVNELISTSLRDLSESAFLGPHDNQNNPIPSPPVTSSIKPPPIPNEIGCTPYKVNEMLGHAKEEWTVRNILSGASLLAKCCLSSLKLGGHSDAMQVAGYVLGRNLALAWQARLDQICFEQSDKSSAFSLINAPLMFHFESEPAFYKEVMDSLDDLDYRWIREVVLNGTGMEKTKELQLECAKAAFEALESFPKSESKQALANIISAM